MARQIVNIGNDANDGSGDTIRDSFNKVNENFVEVYANIVALSDGNVTTDIKGNVFGDDSALLVDAINSSINLNGTVKGNIVPDTDVAYDLGSATNRFRDLYLSGSTIDLGGLEISNADGELQLGGVKIPTQTDLDNAISAPTGDLTGSVFADDSTLLVDGVNGRIVGPIEATTFEGAGAVGFNNDYYNDGFYGGFTTDKPILNIRGADYVDGSDNGGGITISGGFARNDGNNGDVIIASGAGGADGTGFISLLSNYITAAGTWIGTQTMDIKGSVFGDDSTLLVDGVNGAIPASVLEGDISNDIRGSDILIETTTSPGTITLRQEGTGGITLDAADIDFSNSPVQNLLLPIITSGLTAPGSSVVAGETDVQFNFSDGVGTAVSIDRDGNIAGTQDGTISGFARIETTDGNLDIVAENYLRFNSSDNGQIEIGLESGVGNVLLGNIDNGTDVIVNGRLFHGGGITPASSIGAEGDFNGEVVFDNSYIYYCTDDYDGVTNIWKRVAWSGDTW